MNKKENIICDTTPPPINPLDDQKTIEGMLNSQRDVKKKINITFSYEAWKINTLKAEALKESIATDSNVDYTDLIRRAIEEKFFNENK